MCFTQWVYWWIGDLGKVLAEIIVNQARFVRKHGKWRIVTHGADRFLAVFAQDAQHVFQFFLVVAKLFLEHIEFGLIEPSIAYLIVRHLLKWNQAQHVFVQPLAVRVAGFELVVDFMRVHQFARTGINHQQLTRANTAFAHHLIRRVIPNADF